MIQKVYLGVLLLVSIIAATRGQGSTTNIKIFKAPGDSTIGEIPGTSTPWVLPQFVPIINEFKNNVFEDLQLSPQVQNIWSVVYESVETRNIFFDDLNAYLDDIGHPVPAALANIVSKAASRFEPLNMTIFFEADAIHLAEFLLTKGFQIQRDTATKYVDAISAELETADSSNKQSVFQAILTGYGKVVELYGYKLVDVIDELLELYTSVLVILYEQ